MTERSELPVHVFTAPFVARGYIKFYNLRPDRKSPQAWVCDECGHRIVLSKQEEYAAKRH